jgi:hypothetical protein
MEYLGIGLFFFIVSASLAAWLFAELNVLSRHVVTISTQQQDITGSWEANAGSKNFRLLIYHKGNYFGVLMDGVDSWPVKFTYTAPIIRFETKFDGWQYDFEGTVTRDGKRIDGTFSDSGEITYWYAKRSNLPIEPISEQQQAVQLVHTGLENVLQNLLFTTQQSSHASINDLLTSTSQASDQTLQLSSASGASSATDVFGSTGENTQYEQMLNDNTINFEPTTDPVSIPALTKNSASVKMCPKCNAPWDDSFSFCLKCSHSN